MKKLVQQAVSPYGRSSVIMDTILITESEKELQQFLINKGYINAQVTHSVDTSKHKKQLSLIPSIPMSHTVSEIIR